jgi:hypothetical protein
MCYCTNTAASPRSSQNLSARSAKNIRPLEKKFGRNMKCKNFFEVELIIVEISLYGNHTVLQIIIFKLTILGIPKNNINILVNFICLLN